MYGGQSIALSITCLGRGEVFDGSGEVWRRYERCMWRTMRNATVINYERVCQFSGCDFIRFNRL